MIWIHLPNARCKFGVLGLRLKRASVWSWLCSITGYILSNTVFNTRAILWYLLYVCPAVKRAYNLGLDCVYFWDQAAGQKQFPPANARHRMEGVMTIFWTWPSSRSRLKSRPEANSHPVSPVITNNRNMHTDTDVFSRSGITLISSHLRLASGGKIRKQSKMSEIAS